MIGRMLLLSLSRRKRGVFWCAFTPFRPFSFPLVWFWSLEENKNMLTVPLNPTDHPSAFNSQVDFFTDASIGSLSRPHAHKTETPAVLAAGMPSEPRPELPPPAPPPALEMRGGAAPSPSSFQESEGEVHNKNKVTNHPGKRVKNLWRRLPEASSLSVLCIQGL